MDLYIDLETYCEVPIGNGTHAYAQSAEVLLTSWAMGDKSPVTVAKGLMHDMQYWIDQADNVVMHASSDFDRIVLEHQGIHIPHEKVWNTAVQALSHGLPAGLDALCTIMRVPNDMAKLKSGKQLIQLFCKPPPKNAKRGKATAFTHPAQWAEFVEYAGQDVVAMRELKRRLPNVNYPANQRERDLFCLDLRMNDRGILTDLDLARGAIETVAKAKTEMDARTQEMTEDDLRSTTQRDQLLKLVLKEYGVTLPDMQGSTIETRLNDPDLPAGARELLAMRLQTSTTSNAKYNRLLKAVSADGRLRGAIQFCGAARTKRWSGRIFQPQNLPRPDMDAEDIALGIECIKNGSSHLVYDEPIKLASNAIRGVIIAPEGKKLVVSDLAQVEARVLPWLAGEKWKLDAFREFDAGRAPDNYVMAYARGFNVEPKDVDKHGRQIGKVSELSCGYGGSKAAWKSMGALYGFDLPDRQVLDIVNAWRAAHPAICDWENGFWKQLDDAARLAIATPDKTFKAGEFIRFERHKEWLRMLLPSGSYLNYAAPAIIEDPRRAGSQTVSYMGVNNYTRKWERLTTYGGKLSADATQSTAREIMGFNLPLIEFAGYLPTILIHDEVVTECPDTDAYTAEGLNYLLATVPLWAPGLPLAAGGFECKRYRKE